MAAATAAEIKTRLADVLKQAEGSLASYWAGHCAQAEAIAYYTVRDGLLGRGFLLADVDAWDRLHEYTLAGGILSALLLGGAYADAGQQTVEALQAKAKEVVGDKQAGIMPVPIYVAGVMIRPASSQPGQVAGAGPTVAQMSGVFTFSDDPDDPDHGMQI